MFLSRKLLPNLSLSAEMGDIDVAFDVNIDLLAVQTVQFLS